MKFSKKWEDLMVFYGEAHQHPFNQFTHLIGIPVIVCSILTALSLMKAGPVAGGWILVAGLALYYISLDRLFGFSIIPLLVGLQLLAMEITAAYPVRETALYAAAGFFGGYGLQFVGHAVEGKKPSLVYNPIKAMVTAPLFLVAEFYHLAGLRQELFACVERRLGEGS